MRSIIYPLSPRELKSNHFLIRAEAESHGRHHAVCQFKLVDFGRILLARNIKDEGEGMESSPRLGSKPDGCLTLRC